MKKKLLSLALALVLCLGLAVPAFAAGLGPGEEWMGDFVVKGTVLMKYYGDGGEVTIPDGITTIESWAFESFENPISVTIPSSVTTLEPNAFGYCRGLTSVTIPSSVTSIGFDAFMGCTNLTSVTIPSGVTTIEHGSFDGCKSLTSVTIPDGVTSLGANAFNGCESLTSVTIPSSVTSIGGSAFSGCKSLTSMTIPDGVTTIERNTFADCESLTSVSIPSSVSKIESWAFGKCTSLTSVTIPSGVSSIRQVFMYCTGLKGVTIPASVTDAYGAFEGCNGLTDIYYGGTKAQWNVMASGATHNLHSEPTIHCNSTGPAAPAAPSVPSTPAAPAQPSGLTVNPNSSTVLVNGKNVAFDAYTIEGNNYFKLRDLASVLSGTEKQFEVSWDGAANAISLTSGKSYTAVGGELAAGTAGAQTAAPTSSKILLDGKEVALTAYNINNNNYFKLRDIGQAFDFGIGWDNATKTITIDTSAGYTA